MPKRERRFDVVYDFYKYNDGYCDDRGYSGDRQRRRSFLKKSDAVALARQLQGAIAKTLEPEAVRQLEKDLIPSSGFFTKVRVERLLIDRQEIAL